MPDGNQWTIDNLKVETGGSYCYGDSELDCRRYGRLTCWVAAALPMTASTRDWKRTDSTGRHPKTDPVSAWFYNSCRGSEALYRQREGDKRMAISVRCVRQ